MSVYVGIHVHRKRSQVAVTGDGKVQVNRDVVNGAEPVLKLIGDRRKLLTRAYHLLASAQAAPAPGTAARPGGVRQTARYAEH